MNAACSRPIEAPVGPRLAHAAAWWLGLAAARLCRAATAMAGAPPNEDERRYAESLMATRGKLD